MSMFFRIFRQADKNYKIFHKYYRIEDNWNQFSNLSSQNELTQAIKTHQQEWQNFLSKLDQKKIEEIKTLSSQRFDSSPNIIQEKIGKYYYTVKHYYKKDREITQLFQIDDKGNKTLIFDPIQDKIMQQRNIQDFVLEKFHFNEDNSLLGVMIDLQNTEKPMLRIKDVQRNRMLRDKIYNCNDFFFSKNSKYIYYVKINQNQRPFSLYRHKLGNNGTLEDDLIFTEEDDRYFMESILSKSKNFYFIKLSGQQKFKILIAKRKVNEDDEPPQFISINQPGDGLLSIEHNQRGFFFLVQDDQTQKMLFCTEDNFLQQIDKIQLEDSNLKFEDRFKLQEIYKLSTKCVLSEIDFFDDNIIYYIVKKGKSLIINQNLKDNTVQEINPKKDEFGLIKPLTNNNPDEKVCQFSFDSIFSSDENFNLDLQTNKIEQTKQSQMEGKFFNIKNYKMTESFYYSYDGQKIPIILVHSQNKNVDNPKFFSKTLVISYGCYGVPTDIEFDVSLWNYLENNWILAYPLIRGSSDQGIHWHKQTLRKNKYISVQDLIYCFKYLHQSKISHSSLIAAQSNSSGAGLLFSAINNKPHLLKACILQVPFLNFLDLLSQKDLPLAGSDIEEFGDPQNLEEFKNLLQICPYHNIKEDYYPNILLSCYQQDYRTPLWHILNFAKKFRQLAKTDEDEIVQKTKNLFVRINKGSHKGVVQFQEKYKEIAEDYLFLEKSLGQYNVDLQKVEYRLKNLKEIFNQINFKYTIFQCLKQIRIQVKIKLVFLIQQLMNKSLYDDFKKKYNIRSLRKDDYKYSSQKSFLKSKTILDHENIKSTKLNQTQGEANIKENLKESQNCKDLKNICKKIKKQLKEKIEKNSVYIEEIQLQINLSKQKCLNFIEQKMKNIQLQLQKAHNLQEKEQFIFLNKISETYNQLKIMQIEEDQSKINKEQLEDIQTKIQEYNEAIYPQNDIINKESILKIFPKFENKVNNFFEQHELINLDYSKRNKTSRTGPKIKINEKYRSLSVKGNEQTFNNRESIVQRQIDKTQPLYDLPIQKNEQDPQNNKVINPKYQHSEESSDDSQSNNSNLSLQDNMQIQPSKVDFSSNQKQESKNKKNSKQNKYKNQPQYQNSFYLFSFSKNLYAYPKKKSVINNSINLNKNQFNFSKNDIFQSFQNVNNCRNQRKKFDSKISQILKKQQTFKSFNLGKKNDFLKNVLFKNGYYSKETSSQQQMDNNNIFDEFGNVISDDEQIKEEKDLFEIEEVEDEVSNQQSKQNGNFDFHVEDQIEEDRDLYEDQQDFENQQDIYEEGEYMYQEEDEQDLDQPIIQMIEKQSYFFEQKIPQNFEEQFFCQLVQQEKDFRNTGLFGDFQSGKTKMLDVLIQHQTNSEFLHNQKNQSDFWKIEKDKKMTIFSKPVNIITEGSDEKNYLLTVFDTPGHTDLYDETFCIMESVDSAIFVIDVIQGLTMHANTILSDLLKQEIPIFFVLNKMDRFIQEMRLLPEDQYMIIEQIIYQIEQFGADLNKNVFFSSFKYGYLFSLKDFYEIYFNNIIETDFYSDLLFGECFWDQQLQQFDSQKKPQNERTFVQFILNPLYKIFSVLISQNVNELQPFLDELSIQIELDILQKLELKKLIKKIYQQKFCFVKSLFNIIILDTPVSSVRNEKLIKQNVNTTTDIQFLENDIILQLIKYEPLFQKDENTIHYFNIYARILNGKVIQNYSQVNNQQIQNIYGCVIGDQKLKLQKAYSGNIVLLENVDFDLQQKIICSKNFTRNYISNARNGSFVKVSLEPFQPNGMNIFKRSLNKLKKLMLGLIVNIQDTGEHQLQGRGETQLDIAMYFMREVLEIQEVRISDPYVQFAESITQISQIMPEVKTIDQKSSFQFLAEPIQDIYIENFEKLKNLNEQERKSKLKNDLKIDQFTINSLWCLSKDKDHPTLFFEQSLLPRKNKQEIAKYKDIIVQGFQWATNKGPLCQAPIRDCEFKLINFDINEAQLQASQIIPTIQKGIHSAMLLAQPCLKEPIYKFQIMTIKEALSTIYEIISKRRGQIFEEYQVPGFGYMILNGQVPILDSFGLETDIKAQSLGQAQISKIFYKWDIVPGDPLNQKAKIRKLEPSEPMSLARDILLKTRRKQGLTDEISLIKYFNDEKDIINLVDN